MPADNLPASAHCSFDGCSKAVFGRGLCGMHYWRLRRHGSPSVVKHVIERSKTGVCKVPDCGKKHPNGLLLRNNRGNGWTGFAVKNRLEDLETAPGKRITHYALRHSFVTRKLLAGVDSHIVASLAGHRDTKMIDSTYSHVAQDHSFMLEQASKDVTAPNASVKKKRAK